MNYEAVLNASDADGVLALYAEDGVFVQTEEPKAEGNEQIRATYEYVFGIIMLDIAYAYNDSK